MVQLGRPGDDYDEWCEMVGIVARDLRARSLSLRLLLTDCHGDTFLLNSFLFGMLTLQLKYTWWPRSRRDRAQNLLENDAKINPGD
jgi:hypothetical protein